MPAAVELWRSTPSVQDLPPCAEHLARDLYETAVSATCYGTGVLNLLAEPRHLGWKKIEGEDGKRALRRLRELRQRHDPNASDCTTGYWWAAGSAGRGGRFDVRPVWCA